MDLMQAARVVRIRAILQSSRREKTGKLLPDDAARRYETIQWVHFQMGGVRTEFGQVGYFHKFAGKEIADKRAA